MDRVSASNPSTRGQRPHIRALALVQRLSVCRGGVCSCLCCCMCACVCAGKTSLLRCLVGERTPDAGVVSVSPHVVFGYNTQSRTALADDKPVWAEIVGADAEVAITPDYSMPA